MKYIIRLFIVLLLSPSLCLSQEYLPFPTDSAAWYVVDSWPEYDPPPTVWYETYKYETGGDTIINDLTYTKLYSGGAFETGLTYYEGAYRVNNDTECVFFIDEWDNTESLLYDYSLTPGDTIVISGSDYAPYNLVCLDTSSVLINDIPHKTYSIYSYLSNGTECYTTWIKGIGSLRMPIETDMFCAASFEWAYDLSCFYYKDEHIYEWEENPYFEGCIGTNVVIEESIYKNIFAIVPNPVTDVSRIVTTKNKNDVFDYRIIDVNGSILHSRTNVKATEINIQKSLFEKGLYVLQLNAHKDGQIYSIKFITR